MMTNPALDSITTNNQWDKLIADYQSFGGRINNIVQRRGALGLGLFPIDQSKPIELSAPDELLVPVDQVKLENDHIIIAEPDRFPDGYATWYKTFQQCFSWGADGYKSILQFETALRTLPDDIQNLLQPFCNVPIRQRLPSENKNNIFKRFIKTRQINYKGKKVLMPMIELVNHSAFQKSWNMNDDGIHIKGNFEDEILVRYSMADPIFRFMQYGFSCREKTAFSMDLQVLHYGYKVIVNGGVNNAPFDPLNIVSSGEQIIIHSPLLGSTANQRLPRSLFKKALSMVKGIKPDELFDQIIYINRLQVIKILKLLSKANNPIKSDLNEVCLDQLILLSLNS